MSSRIQPNTRKAIMAFIVFLIVASVLGAYFFIHVQQRKDYQTEKNFRVLEQISGNFVDKVENFERNAQGINDAFKQIKEQKLSTPLIKKTQEKLKSDRRKLQVLKTGPSSKELKEKPLERAEEMVETQANVDDSEQALKKLEKDLVSTFDSLQENSVINKNVSISFFDTLQIPHGHPVVQPNRIVQEARIQDDAVFTIWQDLKSFITPLLWQDVFDEHIIIGPNGRLIYKHGRSGILEINTDSLFSNGNRVNPLRASTEKTVRFKGQEYRLFANPFELKGGQQLILIGLQSEEKYLAQSRQVSSFTIIFSLSLFFLLLLSLPFLKLAFLSTTERLSRFDLIMSGASLFAITCMLSLLTLDLFQYREVRDNELEEKLESVALGIEGSLTKELRSAVKQLEDYDRLLGSGKVKGEQTSIRNDSVLTPLEYQNFEIISWLNEKGVQKVKWTVKSQNTHKANVSQRQYFQKIKDNDAWHWAADGLPDFYLESIYSVNTGEPYAVVSIRSKAGKTADDTLEVASMTAKPLTLFQPLLSHGYQFVIIDEAGEILFHSDSKRNLQENLLNDMTNPNEIKSSMVSRTYCTFSTRYHGQNFKASILPIQNWPIHLVTFYDTGYLKTANAEILSFSIIMLAIYGMVLLFLCGIIYFNIHRQGRLRFRINRISWLIPHKGRTGFYQRAGIFHLMGAFFYLIAGILIQSNFPNSYTLLLLLSFLHPVYLVAGSYLILNERSRIWPLHKGFGPVALVFIAGIVLLNILGFHWFPKPAQLYLLLYQVMMLLGLVIFKRNAFEFNRAAAFPVYYKLAVLTFLLAAALPPVFTYFKISHDTEFRLYTKLVQLDYAKKLDKYARAAQKEKWTAIRDKLYSGSAPVNFLYSGLLEFETKPGDRKGIPADTLFTHFYSELRPLYSSRPVETNHLNDTGVVGDNWAWIDGRDYILFNYKFPRLRADEARSELQLQSSLAPFDPPRMEWWPLVWLLTLALLFGGLIYFLIGFVLRKTIIIRQPASHAPAEKDFLRKLITGRSEQSGERNVFLIGLPHSGKTRFLDQEILKGHASHAGVDLQELMDKTADELWQEVAHDSTILILDHFEFGLRDPEIIRRKLEFMEMVITEGRQTMVVVSTVHPLELISSLKLKAMSGMEDAEANQLAERWAGVMDDFYKSFFVNLSPGLTSTTELDDMSVEELIESECRHVDFLKNMETELKDFAGAARPDREEIILRIQSIAAFYYYSLWEISTPEEKYLLYDLAQDGIVNISNVKVISSLQNKGVIYMDGTLKLMNRSFRNFILTTVNPEEALALERQVNRVSTWRVIRMPLMITLIALGFFIFITQRGVYNNAMALIGSLAAALPLLFKVFSSLEGKKSA